jgi:hypothetical protein
MLYTRGAVFNAVVNTFLANAIRLALMFAWACQGQLTGISSLNAIAWGSLARCSLEYGLRGVIGRSILITYGRPGRKTGTSVAG